MVSSLSPEPVYYLRAQLSMGESSLGYRGQYSPELVRAPELALIGHFYVRVDSQATAGAWAHDWCRLQGLTFAEYICLPSLLTRDQLAELDHEHAQALEIAQRDGDAVVVSVVLGKLAP